MTYIPLPPGTGDEANFAGLISIALPDWIRRGELHHVVVRQLTNAAAVIHGKPPEPELSAATHGQVIRWRRVLGTFQINIPVSTKASMRETEELRYSIFLWIAERIPSQSRWYRVFQRYIGLLGQRLTELGSDPAKIKPSQNGYDGLPPGRVRPGHGVPPRHHDYERHGLTGKVEGVVYDHFGTSRASSSSSRTGTGGSSRAGSARSRSSCVRPGRSGP